MDDAALNHALARQRALAWCCNSAWRDAVPCLEDWKETIQVLAAQGLAVEELRAMLPPAAPFPRIPLFEEEQWGDLASLVDNLDALCAIAATLEEIHPTWLEVPAWNLIWQHANRDLQTQSSVEGFRRRCEIPPAAVAVESEAETPTGTSVLNLHPRHPKDRPESNEDAPMADEAPGGDDAEPLARRVLAWLAGRDVDTHCIDEWLARQTAAGPRHPLAELLANRLDRVPLNHDRCRQLLQRGPQLLGESADGRLPALDLLRAGRSDCGPGQLAASLLYLPGAASHRGRPDWWKAICLALDGVQPGENQQLAARVLTLSAWNLRELDQLLLAEALADWGKAHG